MFGETVARAKIAVKFLDSAAVPEIPPASEEPLAAFAAVAAVAFSSDDTPA